ncbi:hypothetical protein H0264_26135 [Nocardia huaxiensis]|uniref:MFS transporter n=1 Tax=Nocardia huaxiensis TaxID=2755382 RepID=A0A7D6V8B8_9NOCA|nr:hypothetical protein [Nocardia huaxiensis]QLY28791.1 hypothetical protein H0264_26135 [Nocardia huaxiensis]
MRSGGSALGALTVAGAWAGPVAGGQLVLLAKPFGGVLGVPGEVVGYIAFTALALACVTGGLAARLELSLRGAGLAALLAGAAFALAGVTEHIVWFGAAVLAGGAATGPVIVIARRLSWGAPAALTTWHSAMAAGVPAAAGIAALAARAPHRGLLIAGILAIASASLTTSKNAGAQNIAGRVDTALPAARTVLGYSAVGLVAGGAVLPTLHLLLFRWEAFAADQAILLLLAAIPATVVVALPGPEPGATATLLLLAAGGPVLVATAPGRASAAIGLAVTLAATARAARGLDLMSSGAIGSSAFPGNTIRSPALPTATVMITVLAGLAGLGAVTVLDVWFGTGTALTLLAVPTALAAAAYRRLPRATAAPAPTGNPTLEGGTP